MDDAARQESSPKQRCFLLGGVVGILRLLLSVEVIEVPEELVEPVSRRQELVEVAEVVLAELTSRIAQRLEQFGDRRILLLESDVDPWHPNLAHARAVHALPRDERRPPRGATLFAVGVGEQHSLI